MKPRTRYLNAAQQKSVREWWQALQPHEERSPPLPADLWGLGRAARAKLRRCTGLNELLMEPGVHVLAQRLIRQSDGPWPLRDEPASYEQVALLAGVLALVNEDRGDGSTLGAWLGEKLSAERRRMSELRFTRLQRTQGADDLLLQWRRAVKLLGGQADVVQLADDLLAWQLEQAQATIRVVHGVKFRWAHDYYLTAREREAAEEPETEKEDSQ